VIACNSWLRVRGTNSVVRGPTFEEECGVVGRDKPPNVCLRGDIPTGHLPSSAKKKKIKLLLL
jgi:hypothetical protein